MAGIANVDQMSNILYMHSDDDTYYLIFRKKA